MNLEFEYKLKDRVQITELDVNGLVVGIYYGETGIQYQVAYFFSGERKLLYLYTEEITAAIEIEKVGF